MANKESQIRIKKHAAQALFSEKRLEDARHLYQQIARLDQDDAEVWAMLGVIAGQSGQMDEAATQFRKAVALRPEFAAAWYNLGKACKDLGHYEEAASSYEEALRLKPDWLEAWNNLGHVFSNLGRLTDAVECYRRVLGINPGYASAYKTLAGLLIALGDMDEATTCIRKLEQLIPDSLDAKIGEIKILQRQLYIEQAFTRAQQLYESQRDILEVDFLYASLCRQTGRIEDAIRIYEHWLAMPGKALDHQQQSMLHFNLGDLYDARQDYRQAFDHYRSANDLKRRAFNTEPFRMEAFTTFIDSLILHFTSESLRKLPGSSYRSDRPIFIVGMPRSGTTLVEQILDSHPEVYGAGELGDIDAIASRALRLDKNGQFTAESPGVLRREEYDALATQYLDRLAKVSTDARYVTDKMPQNFLHLGIISLLFPAARIIHCMRDPLDTCLSCFFQNFGATHAYTYDLEILGRYYKEYQRLMQHWLDVLDIPMLEVSYEALIADPQNMTRTLLDFCNLGWDDRCLRFHENTRRVDTLSHEQVRMPVYTRSVGRWRHYEPFIQPLISSLKQ